MIKNRKILDIIAPHHTAREAIVITGFRRVGKTSVLKHIYESIQSANKIFLDLESPINQAIFRQENYDIIAQILMRKGLDVSKQAWIFLDEIQFIKNLPSAVKYLYDHYPFKFYLTGSSSFYLKNLFSESMMGRKFLFEMFPLDFEEFLQFKDSRLSLTSGFEMLNGFYQEYLQYGGFPSVVLSSSPDRKNIELDNILGSYFQLDVQSLANFHDNKSLHSLLLLLTERVGSHLDMSKLAQTLEVSRGTIGNYLNFFEQTYLITLLRPFSPSHDVSLRHLPKLYFCDTGLINRISQISLGSLFENKIFNQLWIRQKYNHPSAVFDPLNYYQKKTGAEIDFIVLNQRSAYEVKTTATMSDVNNLNKIATKLELKSSKVITLNLPAQAHAQIIFPYEL